MLNIRLNSICDTGLLAVGSGNRRIVTLVGTIDHQERENLMLNGSSTVWGTM